MFWITEDPSSGSLVQCLAKNYKNDSIVSIDMDKVSVMAAYCDRLCMCVVHCIGVPSYTVNCTHTHTRGQNNNNNISVIQLGHLLARSDHTYPEVSSKVCHDSFCQLDSSVSLPWVIYFTAFCLHVVRVSAAITPNLSMSTDTIEPFL